MSRGTRTSSVKVLRLFALFPALILIAPKITREKVNADSARRHSKSKKMHYDNRQNNLRHWRFIPFHAGHITNYGACRKLITKLERFLVVEMHNVNIGRIFKCKSTINVEVMRTVVVLFNDTRQHCGLQEQSRDNLYIQLHYLRLHSDL